MQREQRRTVARLGLLGDDDGNTENAVSDRGPCMVPRTAADADDAAQVWGSEQSETLIGERLDRSDAFEKPLEEAVVFGRSRRDPCLEPRIGDRETLARFGQRIIIEPGRLRRLELRRQTLHLLGREMHEQRRAAGVGGSAGEPALAKAVRINALVRREDRLRASSFTTSVVPREVTASPG